MRHGLWRPSSGKFQANKPLTERRPGIQTYFMIAGILIIHGLMLITLIHINTTESPATAENANRSFVQLHEVIRQVAILHTSTVNDLTCFKTI